MEVRFYFILCGRRRWSLMKPQWNMKTQRTPMRSLCYLYYLSVCIFLSLLIFVSAAGNILVCIAIYTDRGLRRIGNLFLASLAIADMLVAAAVMTFAGVNDLLGYWVFGEQFCDTWVACDVMCSTASILNLCAISLDRYIHIKDPLRYGRWVTRKVAIVTIALIWLLAVLVSFLPISLGLHRPPTETTAPTDHPSHPTCALVLTPTYAVVSSCISFILPCIVMISIYCRLYCYARSTSNPSELLQGRFSCRITERNLSARVFTHMCTHHPTTFRTIRLPSQLVSSWEFFCFVGCHSFASISSLHSAKPVYQILHSKSSRGSAIRIPLSTQSFTPYSTQSSGRRSKKFSRPNIRLAAATKQLELTHRLGMTISLRIMVRKLWLYEGVVHLGYQVSIQPQDPRLNQLSP
ncbi:unnamed protein product [Danaus chrysippus]|uniref:(African queen) hypothetical protein n=1 Tax=Danaus chrysippus TaxID=151541 RepID=A0A8J2QTF6_9NEOP|nr:unnamed protein product [Danaus chrysippus]